MGKTEKKLMSEMYVYVRSEENLWTVGYYDPNDHWYPNSDHESEKDAKQMVHYLNGCPTTPLNTRLERIEEIVADTNKLISDFVVNYVEANLGRDK